MKGFFTFTGALVVALGTLAAAPPATYGAQSPGAVERRVAPNARVSIISPSGSVTVTGGGGDVVRVVSRSEDEVDRRPVTVEADEAGTSVTVRSDGSDVSLEVTVPRSVAFLSVDVDSGNASVTDVAGELRLRCGSGDVEVRNVGRATVFTGSGATHVESVAGDLYVEAGSGDIVANGVKGAFAFESGSGNIDAKSVSGGVRGELASGDLVVRDAGGAVRIETISGTVDLERVGAVYVRSASGDIRIAGASAECDAKTASGSVYFTGAVSPDYAYRFQSMSGDVEMRLCGEVPGFRAQLASYSGEIETSFPLTIDGPVNTLVKKLEGRYGDGRVRIQLEAFSGAVKLLGCSGTTNEE